MTVAEIMDAYVQLALKIAYFDIYPFILPLFPRTNLRYPNTTNTPAKFLDDGEYIIRRMKEQMLRQSYTFDPFIPFPKNDVQLQKDGIHLTISSYEKLARFSGNYINTQMVSLRGPRSDKGLLPTPTHIRIKFPPYVRPGNVMDSQYFQWTPPKSQ